MCISLCLCDMATVEDEVFGSLGLLKLDELLYVYGILALPDLTEDQKVVAILRKRIRKHLSKLSLRGRIVKIVKSRLKMKRGWRKSTCLICLLLDGRR